jgi:hypothetical protein
MANKFHPIGGKVITNILTAPYNSRSHKYYIPASDGTSILINDYVKLVGTSNSDGIPIIAKADPGDKCVGILEGVKSLHEDEDFIYRQANEERILYVKDCPWIEMEIQVNGTITTNDIGKNADIILGAGNPVTGVSTTQLDLSTLTTDSAQLKILGIVEREKNEWGLYTHVRVIFAEHEFKDIPVYQEDIWDRSGTTIVPHNSGDDLDMGSGNITSLGQTLTGLPVVDGIVQTDGAGTLTSSVTLPNGTLATTQSPGDNSTKIATTAYVEAATQEGVDENQIYYTRSGGNDSNDGENIADGFLNYSFAFTTVAGQTPSSTNQYTVSTIDSYVYSGGFNMATLQYTNVFAPNTTVKANDASINSNCTVDLNILQRLSGIGDVLIKTGSGKATFTAKKALNLITGGGGLFMDAGILESNIEEFTVALRTDTLLSANPATSNKIYYGHHKIMRGKIFTTSITDKWFIDSDFADIDFNLNASSELHLNVKKWTGNILASGALTKIYLNYQQRTSNPANDVFDSNAFVYINGKRFRLHRTATNYNPSNLTDHRVIAVTDTSSPRSVIISTENIQEGTSDKPEYFTVKDESINAGTNNITISGESGNIDGAANFVINVDGGSITFYSDGTDLWII